MFAEAAPLFAALGDETRLRLLVRLRDEGPQSIASLTDGTGLTRQAVTKHLGALAAADLAVSERTGRQCIWSAHPDGLDQAMQYLAQISARWDTALDRLQRRVEAEAHRQKMPR